MLLNVSVVSSFLIAKLYNGCCIHVHCCIILQTCTLYLCVHVYRCASLEIRATRWLLWHSGFTKFDFGRDNPQYPPIIAYGIWLSMPPSAFRQVDNSSVQTIYRWNLRFIGFPKMYSSLMSMLKFDSNWQNVTLNTRKMAVLQHACSDDIIMVTISRPTLIRWEMYSTCVWKVENSSVWTIHSWNLFFIGFLMI